jgi:hypothetical protein
LPSDVNIIDTTEIEDSNGDFIFYGSSDDGMIYEFFKPTARNWVDNDGNATAIKTKFQTPYLRVGELGKSDQFGGEGGTGRVAPRYVEIRLKDNTAITWTVTVESADGSSQETPRDSQTMTMDFTSEQSMVRQSLKPHFHPGEFVRFTFESAQLNTYAQITGIRVYFHARPFEGEVGVN